MKVGVATSSTEGLREFPFVLRRVMGKYYCLPTPTNLSTGRSPPLFVRFMRQPFTKTSISPRLPTTGVESKKSLQNESSAKTVPASRSGSHLRGIVHNDSGNMRSGFPASGPSPYCILALFPLDARRLRRQTHAVGTCEGGGSSSKVGWVPTTAANVLTGLPISMLQC